MTSHSYTRRNFIGAAISLVAMPEAIRGALAAQALPPVQAYRNPGCGCCGKWTEHMKAAGFEITMQDDPGLAARKSQLGVPDQLGGCHTALILDYVIEGHVPPEDIVRFLSEKPEALGLAVAGMPVGSPGMEAGESKKPYKVFALRRDGSWSLYASH